MRISAIEELVHYFQSEITRIQAELATLTGSEDPASSVRKVYLDGELAALQKAQAMVTDDEFAKNERRLAQSDERLQRDLASAADRLWPRDVRLPAGSNVDSR